MEFWAQLATLVGVPVGAASLLYTASQSRQSRRATSAAAAIALSDTFIGAWDRYFRTAIDSHERMVAFGDLCNLIETAAAIQRDRLLNGASGQLVEDYVIDMLELINESDEAREAYARLLRTDDTFKNTHWFIRHIRKRRKDFFRQLTP